jgi:hypothetical protein
MKTDVRLQKYLAEFFSKWEMFQTKKIVEKIKTHSLCRITFLSPRKSPRLCDNEEIHRTDRQTGHRRHYNKTRALCMLGNKATDKHSEYVILMAFPRPQLFGEHASTLRLYLHCLSCFSILTRGRFSLQSRKHFNSICIRRYFHENWRWYKVRWSYTLGWFIFE